MTTSIPPTFNETGAVNAPGNAGAGLAALLDALGSLTGGQGAATGQLPADFLQLLTTPAAGTAKAQGVASPVAAAATALARLSGGNTPDRAAAADASLSEMIAGQGTSPTESPEDSATTTTPRNELTLDDLEAVAALLATLWPALAAVQQAWPTASAAGEAETPALPASSTGNQPVQISLKLPGMPVLAVQLPEGANESDVTAALETALAGVQKPVPAAPRSAAPAKDQPSATTPAGQPDAGLVIRLPAVAAHTVEISLPVRPGLKIAAEKIAAKSDTKISEVRPGKLSSEKNFLNARHESVKDGEGPAGIGVAELAPSMPAFNTVRRLPLDEPEIPSLGRVPVAPAAQATAGAMATPPDTSSATATSRVPVPELAHRAVETVLNVVEFQQAHATSFGVVKLHFKFGGEDLAVRLQLSASGEVHTQFSTNSPELRAALSAEWQASAPLGGASGLRLAEPIFTPSGPANAPGFGSNTSGQQFSSSQQHAQQQGQVPVPVWPELRALRRGATAAADGTPRPATASPNSVHLAAVA
jgi:hypothetical protein